MLKITVLLLLLMTVSITGCVFDPGGWHHHYHHDRY